MSLNAELRGDRRLMKTAFVFMFVSGLLERSKKAAIVFLSIMTLLVGMVTTAADSFAASVHHGKGMTIGHQFFGYDVVTLNGRTIRVWCLIYNAGWPNITKFFVLDSIAYVVMPNGSHFKLGGTKTAELRAVLTNATGSLTEFQAAKVYAALNKVAGTNAHAFNTAYNQASTKFKKATQALVNDAVAHHGPTSMTFKITHSPTYVGQVGTAVVHVGGNLSGRPVTFTPGGNVVITAKSSKTNSSGDATVKFVSKNAGYGSVTAAGKNLVPATLQLGNYRAGQQAMVTNSPLLTLKRSVHYSATFDKSKGAGNCGTNCDGTHVPVSLNQPYCNRSSDVYEMYATLNGKKLGTSTKFGPGKCVGPKWSANDRQAVKVWVRDYTRSGTPFLISTITVDCPGWIDVPVTFICSCKGGGVAVGNNGGKLLKNTLAHAVRVRLDAGTSATTVKAGTWVTLKPGASLTQGQVDKYLIYKAGGKAYSFQVWTGSVKADGKTWRDHSVTPVITIAPQSSSSTAASQMHAQEVLLNRAA